MKLLLLIFIFNYALCINCVGMFKCPAIELSSEIQIPSPTSLSTNGTISREVGSHFRNFQPCSENSTHGIQSAGMCLFCSSITRIVACVGMRVTHLPSPEELPPVVDIYQVSNSDVRFISSSAFFNKTIQQILIEQNDIRVLNQRAFKGVHGLKILSLANNNLPYFLTDTMKDLLELEILILDDNHLEFAETGDLIQVDTRDTIQEERVDILGLSLEFLTLKNNPLKNLPKYAFTWLSNSPLSYLSMSGCSIESSHPDALLPLRDSLQELDLSDVTNIGPALTNITNGLQNGTLRTLVLNSCGLVRIPRIGLKNVAETLSALYLPGNTFQNLKYGDFPNMSELVSLDLRRCFIKTVSDGTFDGLKNLRTLILSDNQFTVLHKPFSELNFLKYLDMSGNPDPDYSQSDTNYILQEDSFYGLQNLRALNLANSVLQRMTNNMFIPLKNLSHLSLCNTQVHTVGKRPLQYLDSLKYLDLSGKSPFFSDLESEILNGLSNLSELNITNSNLEFINDFNKINLHLIQLNLNDNYINFISNNTFETLKNLEYLNLDGNLLQSWNEKIFYNNPKLKELSLKNNHISYMTEVMTEEIQNLKTLSIQYNPLLCDCNMQIFVAKMMSNDSNTTVEDLQTLVEPLSCYEPEQKIEIKLYALSHYSLCNEKGIIAPPANNKYNYTAAIIICSAFISVIFIAVVLIYNKRKKVAFVFKNAMASMSLLNHNDENSNDVIYIYDVFVSYCDSDREWVINDLLPALERDAQLRVCLHERDFQPGYGILDNIIYCIDKSKTLLFVVSQRSLRSQWCKFEMHLAQHRFIETNREKFILVLMNDIPKSQRSRTLHYLMATRTYIIWNPEQTALFWKRLKKCLLLNIGSGTSNA